MSTTYALDERAVAPARAELEARGFTFDDAPYAHWRAKAPGATIIFYHSGKLVIQGKESGVYAEVLAPRNLLGGGTRFDSAIELHPGEFASWIGSDESGKGDYFGPLVVCAVRVQRDQLELLDELGAADCKQLTDKQIHELAPGLKAACVYSIVALDPHRYNSLYREMGSNLNRLLAWCHARAIENVLEKAPDPGLAVVDKFGPEHRVQRAMMPLGQKIQLLQRTKAEDDPAVAVASILARNEFLYRLYALGKRFSVKLHNGAGGPVLAAARRFVAEVGAEQLGQVAKLHFKTTQTVTGLL